MSFRQRRPPAGARPGTLAIPSDAPAPQIRVFEYRDTSCEEIEVDDPEQLRSQRGSGATTWVDVQGFGDERKLRAIAEVFDLHPLTLEDAINTPQRPKVDFQKEQLLAVARIPRLLEDGSVETPQVCMVVGPDYVLTFQDRRQGFFDGVRQRIRDGRGAIRTAGAGYLAYALLDAAVDHYYPPVEALAELLEDLEDEVSDDASRDCLRRIHDARRGLVVIRRIGWPQRDAIRRLAHEHSPFVTEDVRQSLGYVEQHITQAMEVVDQSRDLAGSLAEMYLSAVSQRTNDVMKVLTLMASIFIPLTFIAGIYGMNFEFMPELRQRYGYPVALAAMLILALGMLVYFRRKGWLGGDRGGGRG